MFDLYMSSNAYVLPILRDAKRIFPQRPALWAVVRPVGMVQRAAEFQQLARTQSLGFYGVVLGDYT